MPDDNEYAYQSDPFAYSTGPQAYGPPLAPLPPKLGTTSDSMVINPPQAGMAPTEIPRFHVAPRITRDA